MTLQASIPNAPLPALEDLCGKAVSFQTSIKEESPPGVRIDALFTTTVGKDPAVVYNLFGTYFPLKDNFLNTLEITVIEPTFGKAAQTASLRAAPG